MTKPEVTFSERPIANYDDISRWLGEFKSRVVNRIFANLDRNTDHLDRVIEIGELASLPGLFIAVAFYQRDLSEALTRMGLFMGAGKGTSAGTIVSRADQSLKNYQKLVAGHNLPGTVVTDFAARVGRDRDPAEAALLDAFLGHERTRDGGFYLIGVSIQAMKPPENVISHEVFHGYFALRPGYRAVVDGYWRGLGEDERARITAEVGRGYNVADESLVEDEFQAYVLQDGAERDRLRTFVKAHRDPLIRLLRDAGELPTFVR